MEHLSLLQRLAALLLPLIFAITVHEAAHGWVADRLGDPTARKLGRVSFNPMRHIDWLGTLVLPVGLFLLSGFIFGWAKPVPVDFRRLRQPRRDMVLVAAAGPAANLLMALGWSLALVAGMATMSWSPALAVPLIFAGAAGVFINILLMALNLLPLPPLDGGRILTGLLPPRLAAGFARIEPLGLPILLGLLLSGILWLLLGPVIEGTIALLPGSAVVHDVFPMLLMKEGQP